MIPPVFTEQEARAWMWGLIESREWWVLPWISELSGDISGRIERRYYSRGRACDDFQVVMCHPQACGVVGVSFARKRRMTAAQLARLLVTAGAYGETAAAVARALRDQDILLTADGKSERAWAVALLRARAWQAWMQQGRPVPGAEAGVA